MQQAWPLRQMRECRALHGTVKNGINPDCLADWHTPQFPPCRQMLQQNVDEWFSSQPMAL